MLLLGEEGIHHTHDKAKGYFVIKEPGLSLPCGFVHFNAHTVDNYTNAPQRQQSNALPTFKPQESHSGQCAVCLEDFTEGDTGVSMIGCSDGHWLHPQCAQEALVQRPQCPVCR